MNRFNKWQEKQTRSVGRRRPARRRGVRPEVEALEDRLVPSFTPAGSVAVGTRPWTVVAADFNRDGNADFAVTNFGSHSVSVRLGDGQGGFVGVPDLINPDWEEGPIPLAVGQFSTDDIPDLALGFRQRSDFGTIGGHESLLQGNSEGGFTARFTYGWHDEDPRSLAVADFDGDGRL